ncbi:tRNA1(Val) (adenine(37)-N6)-methyltransferase [Salidesulfovibrio onnuriiensis]|uniref:tRNA1(Val) (adenine(37)-N6)-methyltransferase n=1 Tax=Salidesulfovibrio onnuriiensis TaxID=2583823 RepID=UPI0011CCDAB9|nr:methyltransferase [Salidesulfovibrio onnuriiensis]
MDARAYFPRGLSQPEGGYRFSLDSLLLACFSHAPSRSLGVDLGTGCGVVALGMLLRHAMRGVRMTGVELSPESVGAARENADLLELADEFLVVQANVADHADHAGQVDFVVANPPYREPGSGRTSAGRHRATARFEAEAQFSDFCACAARLLKNKGRFSFVHLPERLADLFADLRGAGLEPKRMRMVHSRGDGPARMVLVEARAGGNPGLEIEPPLVLYHGQGQQTRMTPEALAFCPYLECNAGMGDGNGE